MMKRHALTGIIIVALTLAVPISAKKDENEDLPFELTNGLPIVTVVTNIGTLRLIADTGSNATSLESRRIPDTLTVHLDNRNVVIPRVYAITTPVFLQFNRTRPLSHHVNGILGSDFWGQFSSVTFNYPERRLVLHLRVTSPGREIIATRTLSFPTGRCAD
jgi:hypothetical protein